MSFEIIRKELDGPLQMPDGFGLVTPFGSVLGAAKLFGGLGGTGRSN